MPVKERKGSLTLLEGKKIKALSSVAMSAFAVVQESKAPSQQCNSFLFLTQPHWGVKDINRIKKIKQ